MFRNDFTRRNAVAASVAIVAALLVSFSGTHGDRELPDIKPGQPPEKAGDFQLADLHGVRLRLSDVDAPVVLLHFWTKYRDCAHDLELLQKLHAKYRDRGVKIIGIAFNSGTREELIEFVTPLGVEFPTLMCTSEVRNAYDVSTFPTTFLLNGEKQVRYWMYGILVEQHWDQIIADLLAESEKRN